MPEYETAEGPSCLVTNFRIEVYYVPDSGGLSSRGFSFSFFFVGSVAKPADDAEDHNHDTQTIEDPQMVQGFHERTSEVDGAHETGVARTCRGSAQVAEGLLGMARVFEWHFTQVGCRILLSRLWDGL
jgi:hypothetical protein